MPRGARFCLCIRLRVGIREETKGEKKKRRGGRGRERKKKGLTERENNENGEKRLESLWEVASKSKTEKIRTIKQRILNRGW